MSIESGAYRLNGLLNDHHFIAFNRGGELSFQLYKSVPSDNSNGDQTAQVVQELVGEEDTGENMYNVTEPKIILSPLSGEEASIQNLFAFFADDDARFRVQKVSVQPPQGSNRKASLRVGNVLKLYDDPDKHHHCRTRVSSVHPLADGVLITYLSPDGEDIRVAYYTFQDLETQVEEKCISDSR